MKIKPTTTKICITVTFLLFQSGIFAQTKPNPVFPPQVNDFAPIQSFLASPELEGREIGERGSIIAANYIASMMQRMGLKPFHEAEITQRTVLSDYFQSFTLQAFAVSSASVVIDKLEKNSEPVHLSPEKDFTVENMNKSLSTQSGIVVAGYGINSPDLNYNDYARLDAKGKLLVILDGYPGQHDTLSMAWKKFKALAENDKYDLDMRCREAARLGAVAVMVVSKEYLQSKNNTKALAEVNVPDDQSYPDPDYFIPGKLRIPTVTRFLLSESGSIKLAELLNTDFKSIENSVARQLTFTSGALKNSAKINVKVTSKTLMVHNVIGVLPGKDTTHTLILGAHYDHLGKRGNLIYYGSDDNASGVAGLLALAGMWTESRSIPPCNIMFASWTAEEKGLIGSEYFASNLLRPEKVKLYINMDMISRSETSDSTRRNLSIGTRKADENLRELARKSNATLSHPFNLDLWDVTGHSGSDYASFTAKNIPVMTYNTGLHNDYHTPRDIPATSDLVKMGDVLKLVNESLQVFLKQLYQ